MTKRLVTIQDLSCIGRCSLGVAMSVLPAMGIETAVLPTALLSTHTAFDSFTFLDLTHEAERIMRKWLELEMRFDTIYIGYLGSVQLIDLTERFISLFRGPETRVILDPAFGDHGSLYTGFDMDYVKRIGRLCRHADVILPNTTEAAMLMDIPFHDDTDLTGELKSRAHMLLEGKLRSVVITSCRFSEMETGIVCAGEEAFVYPHEHLPFACHGSGDLFASVFAGLLTLGWSFRSAAEMAADFTCDCVGHSMQCPDHRWYGVDYEAMLPELMRRIGGGT